MIDFSAPKVINTQKRKSKEKTSQDHAQDKEDAKSVLKCADLTNGQYLENTIEASEKYMIETQPRSHLDATSIASSSSNNRSADLRMPHYTHLIKLNDRFIFQAACCLPLKVVAASLDGNSVSGKTLFTTHSTSGGGKLVYEFLGTGKELVVDVKRGDSAKAQRLIFLLSK
ncbi:MAG: hypothetical protein FJ264_04525 [Planctomycetes bacterium]|nr:hypothetical protein [Planctomycetota bacterium]